MAKSTSIPLNPDLPEYEGCAACHFQGEVWRGGRGHRFAPCPACRPEDHKADEEAHANDYDPLHDGPLYTPA